MLKKKKILVTGCAGFIGSHLCEKLLKFGYIVFGIDNLINGKKLNLKKLLSNKNFNFFQTDINNEKVIEEVKGKVIELCSKFPVYSD